MAFLSLYVSLILFALVHFRSVLLKNTEEVPEIEFEGKQSRADKQLSMWFQAKGYPNPENLSSKYEAAWQQHLELRNSSMLRSAGVESASWSSLGSSVNNIGGRILCLAIDPNNSDILWAGSASGGIWKSINRGNSWSPVITNLPVLGVSSILVDPANSNTIYAGTGEVYRVDTSNIGFNVWKSRGTYGIGIIKSTDGGNTWSQVFTKTTSELFAFQMLKFHPGNSNTIYACGTDGLYRSTNNGVNWTQILSKIYVSDVAVNPSNTDQIVVGVGNLVNSDKGIYRTTNGSSTTPTWVKIASGLPASFMGYIRLSQTGTSNLYASIGLNGTTSGNELYESANFGSTWTAKSNSNHCNYQHWFSHDVAVNPFNYDSLLIMGVSWYRYRVSNSQRTSVTTPGHADVHDIVYDPVYRGRIFVAHDGGVSISTNGGSTFSDINNGLNATQFYASLGVHPTDPDIMIGGLQDNGVVRFNGSSWSTAFGGDGGPSAIAPNGTTVIASNDARSVRRSTTGTTGSFSSVLSSWAFSADDRTGFMAPVAISKSNGSVMYVGSDNIHKSTDGGGSWTNPTTSSTNYIDAYRKTAIALAVSPTNPDKVYASTSPFAQNTSNDYIWVNGLCDVRVSTAATPSFTSIKNSLPDRFVMDFAISPTNDDSVFVALGGFGTQHIYVTGNGGTTWTARGSGLPDVPFNALVFDPINSSILYAGSDFGVYVSPDRGTTWLDYNNGFWDATLVMDLQISADNMLVAATHGKGVFKSALFTGTLPVSITSFSGYHQAGKNILEWMVQGEYNILHYEIEKSADRVNYSKIGSQTASNASGVHSYSFTDLINSQPGIYYYRLKIVETDGSFSYSRTVMLHVGGTKNFQVLNNPFTGEIRISMNVTASTPVVLNLYDMTGKMVKRKSLHIAAGPNSFSLDGLDFLTKAVYMLEVVAGQEKFVRKMVKN